MAHAVGFKAVKLAEADASWQAWDKSGRHYGLVELDIPADAVVGTSFFFFFSFFFFSPFKGGTHQKKKKKPTHTTVVPQKKEEHHETAFVGKRRTDRAVVRAITDLDGHPAPDSLVARSGTTLAWNGMEWTRGVYV